MIIKVTAKNNKNNSNNKINKQINNKTEEVYMSVHKTL